MWAFQQKQWYIGKADVDNDDCNQRTVSRLVWKWMKYDFPKCNELNSNKIRSMYAIVLAWLMPEDMKHGR